MRFRSSQILLSDEDTFLSKDCPTVQTGSELDAKAVGRMQRLLSAATPRVRAYGGARFDSERAPSAEWTEFGAYTFVLPR